MRTPFQLICILFLATSALAQSDAPPATTPGALSETLGNAGLLFAPPANWTRTNILANGRTIAYKTPEGNAVAATMVVNVDPQDVSLPKSTAAKLGAQLLKRIEDRAAKEGSKLLAGPTIEPDDALFLRIRSKIQAGDKVTVQVQLYRVIEENLIAVAVSVSTDSDEAAKPVVTEAEAVIASVHSRTAAEVVKKAPMKNIPMATGQLSLPNVKLKTPRPADWQVFPTEAASGLAVTFREPNNAKISIIITVKAISAEEKTNVKLRQAAAEALSKEAAESVKIDDTQTVGGTDAVVDKRFLHKARTKYKTDSGAFNSTSRELRVGDTMISVTAVAPEAEFDSIDKLADQIATQVRVERVTEKKP